MENNINYILMKISITIYVIASIGMFNLFFQNRKNKFSKIANNFWFIYAILNLYYLWKCL
jgi:hypothetical protein